MRQTSQTLTLGSVTTSATALTFVQLPNIPCDSIIITYVPNAIGIALQAGALVAGQYVAINAAATVQIPTGGNASNLYITNTVAAAVTIGFLAVKNAATTVNG